jgi:hypothetical protein
VFISIKSVIVSYSNNRIILIVIIEVIITSIINIKGYRIGYRGVRGSYRISYRGIRS